MTDEDKIISVHKLRRAARIREHELQAALDIDNGNLPDPQGKNYLLLKEAGVPSWARGVKVVSAGFFQHAVVATRGKGR